MTEKDPNYTKQNHSYTPASFEKRAAAWMGIVYVLMLMFVFNFTLFSGGGSLAGTFPLFLVPISAALAVVILYRLRKGHPYGGMLGAILALIACAAGIFLGMWLGVPPLLGALGVF